MFVAEPPMAGGAWIRQGVGAGPAVLDPLASGLLGGAFDLFGGVPARSASEGAVARPGRATSSLTRTYIIRHELILAP